MKAKKTLYECDDEMVYAVKLDEPVTIGFGYRPDFRASYVVVHQNGSFSENKKDEISIGFGNDDGAFGYRFLNLDISIVSKYRFTFHDPDLNRPFGKLKRLFSRKQEGDGYVNGLFTGIDDENNRDVKKLIHTDRVIRLTPYRNSRDGIADKGEVVELHQFLDIHRSLFSGLPEDMRSSLYREAEDAFKEKRR